MIKLKFRKISDKSIGITVIAEHVAVDENVFAAVFRAYSDGGLVVVKSPELRKTFNAAYDEIEVNGMSYASADIVTEKLNEFIGNFRSGGSSPSPTGAEWGSITGTITAQQDLIDYISEHAGEYFAGDGINITNKIISVSTVDGGTF